MVIKDKIPNEKVLKDRIISHWGTFNEEVTRIVGPLEADYKRVRGRQKLGKACFIVVVVFFLLLNAMVSIDFQSVSLLGNTGRIIPVLFCLLIMVGFGIASYRLMRDHNNSVGRFNWELNKLMFHKVLDVFKLKGAIIEPTIGDSKEITPISNYTHDDKSYGHLFQFEGFASHMAQYSPEYTQVLKLLDHSALVTEKRNTVLIDDMVTINWQGRTLFLTELNLKHITGSGKNRKTKKIFSGYFVSFDLTRPLEGKTFISTEGDTKGFGHQSFWNNIRSNDISVTELEWNDFENLLHVATNNPTEARYVLSTDFMSDLYDWWKNKKRNIRIAFIDSRMYILFPSKDIRFKNTAPSLQSADLQDYALSIASPLMHVLHLIEDVKI